MYQGTDLIIPQYISDDPELKNEIKAPRVTGNFLFMLAHGNHRTANAMRST
jgi:hypothetical protein